MYCTLNRQDSLITEQFKEHIRLIVDTLVLKICGNHIIWKLWSK